ncbi:RNA polymerase subunit sigma [Flavobacterium magnum]|uniref:RNA polymerase subunit sigma n=1 Tax=Flavobacterium magnum TaxID=2162713 RepID=A0A2S0RFZ1_9FLAO|nr:RNA polymerase sigma factor [Flavobacterium magnum]AWA30683.1 RNA polymerase subunit sigma [Flavobacterium magnum]
MDQNQSHIDNLIRLCRDNSRSAQFELYNLYYKAMYNTALRIVKDIHWAEDVMQESFLKAFTKLDSFKGEVTFGSWLKRIVINHSIDNYKKLNKQALSPIEDVLYKVGDHGQEPEGFDFTGMKAQQILDTIKSLKDNYRLALTLLFVEGYDQEEISEIMNINAGNCRTLISRAKESLRQKLDNL